MKLPHYYGYKDFQRNYLEHSEEHILYTIKMCISSEESRGRKLKEYLYSPGINSTFILCYHELKSVCVMFTRDSYDILFNLNENINALKLIF